MKNQELINSLNALAQVDNTWQNDVVYYEQNSAWLDRSAKIAIHVLSILRQNRKQQSYPASQKELSELMQVSPQQVNKILQGKENLTLETISKLEKALKVQLIAICQVFEAKSVLVSNFVLSQSGVCPIPKESEQKEIMNSPFATAA